MNHEFKVSGRILPVSEATKRRNPEIYGRAPVAGLEDPKPEQRKVPALASHARKQTGRNSGLVQFVVTIVSHRKRLCDDDNISGGAKALRDAVAATIGIDDGDKRIRFEYAQIETRGGEGTAVTITKKEQIQ